MAQPMANDLDYQRVPFPQWRKGFKWQLGEHVSINGPTGVGKTTIIRSILPARKYVLFLATKTHDDTYDGFLRTGGFHRVYDHRVPRDINRAFIWPKSAGSIRATQARQREVFRRVLDRVYDDGNWTLVIDEAHWVCNELRLGDEIAALHHQGRSHGLTLLDGMQRPANVPVIVHSSATHQFLFKLVEPLDIKRLSGNAGVEPKRLLWNLNRLRKHEFIYLPTRADGEPIISETMPGK